MSLGQDSNQRPLAPKANTITTQLKRILPNAVAPPGWLSGESVGLMTWCL